MKQYKLIVKPVTRTRSTGENRAREMNLWDLHGLTALSLRLQKHAHTCTHTVQDWITVVKLEELNVNTVGVLGSNCTSACSSAQYENYLLIIAHTRALPQFYSLL